MKVLIHPNLMKFESELNLVQIIKIPLEDQMIKKSQEIFEKE